MAKRKGPRRKHVPQRTCVGCRKVLAKRELVRVVRKPEGVFVDPTGREAGRGAYLHNLSSCWEGGIKGTLARALKRELSPEDLERMKTFMETIPDEKPVEDDVVVSQQQ